MSLREGAQQGRIHPFRCQHALQLDRGRRSATRLFLHRRVRIRIPRKYGTDTRQREEQQQHTPEQAAARGGVPGLLRCLRQCRSPLACRLPALLRLDCHGLVNACQQCARVVFLQLAARGQRLHAVSPPLTVGTVGRSFTGNELEEGAAQRVNVRPCAELAMRLDLLKGRVPLRLHMRVRARADELARRAEVNEQRPALGREQNIVGFDVAVQQVFVMQVIERLQQLPEQVAQPGFRGGTMLRAPCRQRLPLDARHHIVSRAHRREKLHHLDNVRVVELRQRARLVNEIVHRPLP